MPLFLKAKKEIAQGHEYSEHAERARKEHPLAMLPGTADPIDEQMLVPQIDQALTRPRNVSNAEFDNAKMLQTKDARMEAVYETVEITVHNGTPKHAQRDNVASNSRQRGVSEPPEMGNSSSNRQQITRANTEPVIIIEEAIQDSASVSNFVLRCF